MERINDSVHQEGELLGGKTESPPDALLEREPSARSGDSIPPRKGRSPPATCVFESELFQFLSCYLFAELYQEAGRRLLLHAVLYECFSRMSQERSSAGGCRSLLRGELHIFNPTDKTSSVHSLQKTASGDEDLKKGRHTTEGCGTQLDFEQQLEKANRWTKGSRLGSSTTCKSPDGLFSSSAKAKAKGPENCRTDETGKSANFENRFFLKKWLLTRSNGIQYTGASDCSRRCKRRRASTGNGEAVLSVRQFIGDGNQRKSRRLLRVVRHMGRLQLLSELRRSAVYRSQSDIVGVCTDAIKDPSELGEMRAVTMESQLNESKVYGHLEQQGAELAFANVSLLEGSEALRSNASRGADRRVTECGNVRISRAGTWEEELVQVPTSSLFPLMSGLSPEKRSLLLRDIVAIETPTPSHPLQPSLSGTSGVYHEAREQNVWCQRDNVDCNPSEDTLKDPADFTVFCTRSVLFAIYEEATRSLAEEVELAEADGIEMTEDYERWLSYRYQRNRTSLRKELEYFVRRRSPDWFLRFASKTKRLLIYLGLVSGSVPVQGRLDRELGLRLREEVANKQVPACLSEVRERL